ncbi:hypothetical protein V1638_11590 [Pseudarthrobacter sp. J64]|uniref:hypothetical protein n=1 Tax=Pseudarthrobacter sp. J64 TaxID=3116485 RepID=UPI002E81537A|nr:hypothetical protein [Pseudarthrobacter sp. J64]MEE2570035.1 hypothetical protein [Pseudarthrobacter sp. J64]
MDDVARMLILALRHRPATVAELAAHAQVGEERVRGLIAEAEQLGFLDCTDGRLSYRRPEVAAAESSRKAVAEHAAALSSMMARNDALLRTLPDLLHAWEQGETQDTVPRTDILHGPNAPIDVWRRHFAQYTPQEVLFCVPDVGPLLEWQGDGRHSSWLMDALSSATMRTLVSEKDAADPRFQPLWDASQAKGRGLRMHPNLPSLFWVSDGSVLGIPLKWGEFWPRSMMSTESEAFGGMLVHQFEALWNEASELTPPKNRPAWEPMLRLMGQGMTMEAAAVVLGFTSRTGRRRVSEAMRHFGVSSQFTLGAAWAAHSAARNRR